MSSGPSLESTREESAAVTAPGVVAASVVARTPMSAFGGSGQATPRFFHAGLSALAANDDANVERLLRELQATDDVTLQADILEVLTKTKGLNHSVGGTTLREVGRPGQRL